MDRDYPPRYDVGMQRLLRGEGPRWQNIILLLLALFFAGTLFVLMVPATLINTTTLKYALRRFGGDYRPSASELSLRVASTGLLTKRVVLEARDLCVDEFHGAATGCLPILKLDAVVRLGVRPLMSVRRLERLVVLAGELSLDSTKVLVPPVKKYQRAKRGVVPAWAARMSLGTIDVRIPRAVLTSTAGVVTAGLAASYFSLSTAPLTAEVYAILKGTDSAPGRRWDANLTLDSDLFREGRLTSLDAMARVHAEGGLSAVAVGTLETRDGMLRGSLDAFAASTRGRFRLAALEGCRIEPPDAECRVTVQPAGRPKPAALRGAASMHARKATIRVNPAPGYAGFVLEVDAGHDAKSAASAIRAFLRWFETY